MFQFRAMFLERFLEGFCAFGLQGGLEDVVYRLHDRHKNRLTENNHNIRI